MPVQTYLYDDSLEGLLTAVFEFYERHPGRRSWKTAVMDVVLCPLAQWQPDAFSAPVTIHPDPQKASRVWAGLLKKVPKDWIRKIYCCFLAESTAARTSLFNFMIYIFDGGPSDNFGHAAVHEVAAVARSVEREKHRMEAFIRFEKMQGNLFYAAIDPDFNVLPLIAKHFQDRYADQHWVIYDLRRNYGLQYASGNLEEITLSEQPAKADLATAADENEALYAQLWKDYFNSTNIKARKNTRLHLRHVPKRYWKYLTEKLPS